MTRVLRTSPKRGSPVRIYSKRFLVPDDAIDRQGHVNNLAYVAWMQDAAIEHSAAELTSAGMTSLLANRKALRLGQEPLDVFCRYMSHYAREQAYCLYSPALIDNLERNWDAKRRTL